MFTNPMGKPFLISIDQRYFLVIWCKFGKGEGVGVGGGGGGGHVIRPAEYRCQNSHFILIENDQCCQSMGQGCHYDIFKSI